MILSSISSQKCLGHAKQSATDALKTNSKNAIQKIAEATGDLIDNNIANKITQVSKISKTATNEHDKEIPKERYISPDKSQEIFDDLKLK